MEGIKKMQTKRKRRENASTVERRGIHQGLS